MKPLSKKILKFVFIFITILVGVVMKVFLVDRGTSDEPKQQIQGGTMSYLQALCDKDYSTCDTYVASDGYRITGFTSDNPVETKIYYQFLDYIVDSIKSVKVLSIKDNKSSGYTEYEIEVCYIPYETIGGLDVDSEKLNSLMDKYVDEKITDEEFSTKIQDYYFELFKTCFKLSSDEYVTSKVLMLSEKEDENGVVCVYNTQTFIESLISDEMYNNLEVYQNNIKAKVDTVLRQY